MIRDSGVDTGATDCIQYPGFRVELGDLFQISMHVKVSCSCRMWAPVPREQVRNGGLPPHPRPAKSESMFEPEPSPQSCSPVFNQNLMSFTCSV